MRNSILILILLFPLSLLFSCVQSEATQSESNDIALVVAADLVSDIPTTQYFTDEAVSKSDIQKILEAGVNAPSAMNRQAWHFSVVTDKAILSEIAVGMVMPAGTPPAENIKKAGIEDAPLAIIISCSDSSAFDSGLACQNMSVVAELLGYGTKIISSPTIALNGERQDEYRELLDIPADYSAIAVLLVGHEDTSIDETVDGYTGATVRNPFDSVVSFIAE